MHTVLAWIALGLFGWLGYTVWTDSYQVGYTGKARALGALINMATDHYGTHATAILLFSAGLILAFVFQIMASRQTRE
jgi:TRAP-type C4-dicarboxylate transport system permease small subunit